MELCFCPINNKMSLQECKEAISSVKEYKHHATDPSDAFGVILYPGIKVKVYECSDPKTIHDKCKAAEEASVGFRVDTNPETINGTSFAEITKKQ